MNNNIILTNQSIEFFNHLFGLVWSMGYFVLWRKIDEVSISFSVDEINKVPEFLNKMNSENQTIFFEVALQKERHNNKGRGKEETVSVVSVFCIDIDIVTPLRKLKDMPQSFDEALILLHKIDLTPSIITWTGAGFQAYWVLNPPLIINNNTDMQLAKMMSDAFTSKIQTIASELNLRIDNVSALNHLMRIPGTFNNKYPNGVSVIYDKTELRYDSNKLYDWSKNYCVVSNKKIQLQNKFDGNSPGALNKAIAEYPTNTPEYISAINTYIWKNVLILPPPIEVKIITPANNHDHKFSWEAPADKNSEPTPNKIKQLLELPYETPPVQLDTDLIGELLAPKIKIKQEPSPATSPLLNEFIERCAFLKHCRDDSTSLTEPEWFLMIAILAHEDNGDKLIHELSKNYPKYTISETDKYIQKSLSNSPGPVKCETVKTAWNCNTDCGVTCPVHLLKSIQQELQTDEDDTKSSNDLVDNQVLKERIHDVSFPEDIFPKTLLNALKNLSKMLSVENTFVFCAALVVISTVMGSKFKIHAKKGYSTFVNLWMAVVGETGQKKTPVFKALNKVLYDIQGKLTEKYMRDLQAYNQQKAPNASKPKTNTKPVLLPLNVALITTDPTIEALIGRLKDSPKGIIRFNDEIIVLLDGFDKYKGKQSGEKEIYLSLFNSTPIKVDRVEKSTYVPNPFLCLLGGIQPQKLRKSFTAGTFDDGFCARFLFYLKDNIYRELNRNEWTVLDNNIWESLINALYDYNLPQEYYLGNEAWEVFKKYSGYLAILSKYSPNRFKGFPEKMETYSLRFAGIIHVLGLFHEIEVDTETISKVTMEKAVELSNYFLYQARKMFEVYSPKDSSIDNDSRYVMESIVNINQIIIPIATILIQFNSLVDSLAVIRTEKTFGKLVYKVMKDLNIHFKSEKVYQANGKQKKCLILTDKAMSQIQSILTNLI